MIMIKHVCDICGKDLPEHPTYRIEIFENPDRPVEKAKFLQELCYICTAEICSFAYNRKNKLQNDNTDR